MLRLVRLTYVAALCSVVGVFGCGGGPKRPSTAPVTGTVKYDGKPLPAGSLLFVPVSGGPSAQGNIQPDGRYNLGTFSDTDGATIGEFQVIVTAYAEPAGGPLLPEDTVKGKKGADYGQQVTLIPESYGDLVNSGLTAKVEAKPNVIDFDLAKRAK